MAAETRLLQWQYHDGEKAPSWQRRCTLRSPHGALCSVVEQQNTICALHGSLEMELGFASLPTSLLLSRHIPLRTPWTYSTTPHRQAGSRVKKPIPIPISKLLVSVYGHNILPHHHHQYNVFVVVCTQAHTSTYAASPYHTYYVCHIIFSLFFGNEMSWLLTVISQGTLRFTATEPWHTKRCSIP